MKTGITVSTGAGAQIAPCVEVHDDGEPAWARPLLVVACVLALVAIGLWWP